MTLTATQVKAITKPGRYGDGAGLYLVVRKTGSRNWILRSMVADRRTDIGLGGYPTVSLAKAREKAREYKTKVADGNDPTVKTPQRTIPTFEQAALATYKANLPKWRSEEHADGWIRTLRCHVFPAIGDKAVDQVTRADVLDILAPLWGTKQETARRLRQRIRTVFKWAIAYEYVDSNPAGELLDGALPAIKINKTHWRAMPYAELPDALKIVQNTYASIASKLSFQFLALTAARSGEVRGATWDEIDWDRCLWTIPGHRMKGGVEHRVPLSQPAMSLLRQAWALREEGEYIFPSPKKAGQGLSDMTWTKVLRSTGLAERMTVHGIRSSFRDWVSEQTATPWAVAELALAHRVGNAVEQAYHRTDLLDRRRELMDAWADFLGL